MSEALEILKSCDAFLEATFMLSSGRHFSAYCQMAYLHEPRPLRRGHEGCGR